MKQSKAMNAKTQSTFINAVIYFITVTLMFITLQVQAANALKAQKSNTVIDIGMYADYNRDGKIEPGVDNNTKTNPYVFWINDDDDDDDSETRNSFLGLGFANGTDAPGEGTSDSTGLASGGIDGTRDLIDFFAVHLDLHSFINQSSDTNTYKYIIKQADSAVNIVYTKLERQNIEQYLEQINVNNVGELLCKDLCQNSSSTFALSDVETRQVKNSGFGLPKDFVEMIKSDKNKGVILVEGRIESSAPLVLEILNKDNKKIHSIELPLKLTGAESMYRFITIRECTGVGLNPGCAKNLTGDTASTEINKPLNLPNNISAAKQVIFTHGFNVNEDAARGASAEVFKRLFHAGAASEFNAIAWTGDEGTLPAAFWNNVVNAFNTAIDFKSIVDQIPGTNKTVIAHSLGNMMVSSAIQDHLLGINQYLMLNAAVAIEAFSGGQLDIRKMRHSDWDNYYQLDAGELLESTNFDNPCGRRLWASDWYQLFDSSYLCKGSGETIDFAFTGSVDDRRNDLTWRERFKEVANRTNLVQFYSSGEDVVRAAEEGDPGLNQLGTPFNGGIDAWNFQEKSKGTQLITAALQEGDVQGGWGYRICDTTFDPQNGTTNIYCNDVITPVEAFAQTNAFVRDTPLFHELNTVTPATDEEVNDLLAYAIPSLSLGVGGAAVIDFENALPLTKSVDMNSYPGVGNNPDWPEERPLDRHPITNELRLWHHSDFKDVAYRYVSELYDEIVSRGGLN